MVSGAEDWHDRQLIHIPAFALDSFFWSGLDVLEWLFFISLLGQGLVPISWSSFLYHFWALLLQYLKRAYPNVDTSEK